MSERREDEHDEPAAGLLSIVAPAAEHLVNAIGEIAAAGQAVISAVPASTRKRYSRTLSVGGTALGILGSLARSAAGAARSRSREKARKEALAEIAAALDAHADRVTPPAAKALRAVREVLAGEEPPKKSVPKKGSKRSSTRAAARKAIAREVKKTRIEG